MIRARHRRKVLRHVASDAGLYDRLRFLMYPRSTIAAGLLPLGARTGTHAQYRSIVSGSGGLQDDQAMKFTLVVCAFVFALFVPLEAATLTFVNTTDGGHTYVYSGSVQNNQQIESGDYVVIFDFAGLVSGEGPSVAWAFNLLNDVPGQPDDPSKADATFTYTGTTITGVPGGTPLGTFILRTTADGQQQGSYSFQSTRSDGPHAGDSVTQSASTTVAADANATNAVPEPSAMLLVGGGLIATVLSCRRKSVHSAPLKPTEDRR
jgi:hypothetical protein